VTATSSTPRRPAFRWRPRDVWVTILLGLAFGLFMIGFVYLHAAMVRVNPLVLWSMAGIPFLPSFFIAYTVRRPGAIVLGQLMAGLVQLPFTPWGGAYLVGVLLCGIITEVLMAAITRYRLFSWAHMATVGAVTGAVFFVAEGLLMHPLSVTPVTHAALAVLAMGSGTLSALIAKSLADAVARAGVLDAVLSPILSK
jgi:ABC-type thiamin/hydroxymethylpyrimidine transport system permease subunit